MKKSVGIYVGPYYYNWDDTSVEAGIGGSESWALEVALELSKLGYEVIVYADPVAPKELNSSCQLVPYIQYFSDLQQGRRFDYFIYSRVIDQVSPWLKCDNIYAMAHDVTLISHRPNSYNLSRIKKVGYLSDWHKDNLLADLSHHGLVPDRLFKTINGFSDRYYTDTPPKSLSTVWSSSLLRGFFMTYELVYYPIIKEIPEFKIYVCSGTQAPKDKELLDRASLLPNVEVLGKLSKKELAEYQQRSMVWIYPGEFKETFCITAVENAYAGNALICPPSYGLSTTLKGYNLWSGMTEVPILTFDDGGASAQIYIDLALKCLRNPKLSKMYADSAKECCKYYTWSNAAKSWHDEFQKCNEVPLSQLK